MKFRLIHRGIILVSVPLLVAMVVTGSVYALILENDSERLAEARQSAVQNAGCRAVLLTFQTGRLLVQVFDPKRGTEQSPETIKAAKKQVKENIAEIRSLGTHMAELDPVMKDRVEEVNSIAQPVIDAMRNMITLVHNPAQLLATMMESRHSLTEPLLEAELRTHAINYATIRLLDGRPEREAATFRNELAVLLGGGLCSLIAAVLLARWFFQSIAARLLVVEDNANRMARGDALHPALGGEDEIARLDADFHEMAAAVKAALEKERALFENAADVIVILDSEFRLTAANPASYAALGRSPGSLVGSSFFSLVASDDVAQTRDAFETAKQGLPPMAIENRLSSNDGTIDCLWSVYWSEQDQALYAIAHDITERKRMERLKEDFLAMVSHDLRTPIGSILGSLELMAANAFGVLAAPVKQQIDATLLTVKRLLSLINDLLDVEKLEAGKLDLIRERTEVRDLVNRAISEVAPLASGKGISINCDSEDIEFFLDSDRVMQVMVNLLSNAVKFSPSGSRVDMRNVLKDGVLHVEVEDHGRGISDSQRQEIFQRFKQSRGSDSKTGTGLGLPICKMIVEAHGGSIGVDSTPGKGSRFWFELPAEGVAKLPLGQARTYSSAKRKVLPPMPTKTAASPFDKLSLSKKGLLVVGVPLLVQLSVSGALVSLLAQAFQQKQVELHHRIVATVMSEWIISPMLLTLSLNLADAQKNWRGFNQAADLLNQSEERLLELTAPDGETHSAIVDAVSTSEPAHRFIQHARQTIGGRRFTDQEFNNRLRYDAYDGRDKLIQTLDQLGPKIEQLLTAANNERPDIPVKLKQLRRNQGMAVLAGILGCLATAAVAAIIFTRGIVLRLNKIQRDMDHLKSGEVLSPALPGTDEVAHLDRVLQDMARALREARKREHAVFDNARDVMCMIDAEGMITQINPAAVAVFARETKELIGESLMSLVSEPSEDTLKQQLLVPLLTSEPVDIETTIHCDQGPGVTLLWSVSRAADGHSLACIGHDITQRKELERLKREFLSMVSHDIRTPLTGISLSIESLSAVSSSLVSEKVQQQFELILRNCDRLLRLINNLLDLDRLESGQMPLSLQTVSVSEILRRTAEAVVGAAQKRNLKLVIDVPEDLGLNCDEDRLVQVGVNLASNAIKFSAEGAEIRLSASQKGDAVEICVADKGRGIPATHVESVFERFRQVEASDSKRTAGTGLGLPICKQIVEQHGGRIWLESEVGAGTRFYCSIPGACRLDGK